MVDRMKKYISLFLLLLILALPKNSFAEKIRLVSLDWEPYVGSNLKDHGYVGEIIKKSFKNQGMEVEITYLPWARVISVARSGEYDGYFPEYFSPELKKEFKISNAFPGGPLVFLKKKKLHVTYEKLEDLKPFKIGVVRGYINTEEFDKADYLIKDAVKDDFTNLKKLATGRIDLMVVDKFVGYHLINLQMQSSINLFEVLEPPLEKKDLYLCISLKAKQYAKKLNAFNIGLEELRKKGEIEKILKKHGF